MTGLINIPIRRQTLLQPVNLLILGYVIIAMTIFQGYLLVGSVNFMVGLLALPFAWKTDASRKGYGRYGWLTLAVLILCFMMPVKTLLYFSIGFALLYFTEFFYGKTSLLALLVIIFASPVFQYLGDVFSFPIRLQLTQIAGSIFNIPGPAVEVKGNMLILKGNEFSVDPACMGLSMITASLLSGVMCIAFYQEKYKRRVKNWTILSCIGIILILNVVSNLARIMLLVQFNIKPGTMSHDIAGLGCLLMYVLLPTITLTKFIVRRAPVLEIDDTSTLRPAKRWQLMHAALFGAILFLSFRVAGADTFERFNIPSTIEGFSLSYPSQGIVKLDRPGSLVYVKYIRGFYDTEHNPMICWTGGGYQFKNVQLETIGDRKMFTGTITNGTDQFYSAWWYDNGIHHTTNQLNWRWDLVRGAHHYVLVNISCPTKDELITEVKQIIQQKTLTPFFN